MRRQCFSLIEILQTIILIGIVAGLAISFLRVTDREIEIFYATEKQLVEAIKESGRQMCADTSLHCTYANYTVSETDYCSGLADERMTNVDGKKDGYCYTDRVIVSEQSYCPAGYNENSRGECYRNPVCKRGSLIKEAVYLSSVVCENAQPKYNKERNWHAADGSTFNYNEHHITEFCGRMHGIVNHIPQRLDASPNPSEAELATEDFWRTCSTKGTKVIDPILTTHTGKTIYDINNKIKDKTSAFGDNANMVLPNGVRVYGLAGSFKSNKKDIYVKFDKAQMLDTILLCIPDNPATPLVDEWNHEDCNTMLIRVTLNASGELSSIKNLSTGVDLL